MTVNLSALAGAGQQFFSNNGVPLNGGKLYSYAAGTTTPQTTYTSVSGATPHANPIVLDSSGRVATGEIWLTAGSNYKFVLTDSNDVLIATWDNITGINGTGITSNASNVQYDPDGVGAVSTNVQDKLRQTVSVKDFGAVGNGVANDTTAIQAALTANSGNTVVFPPGIYKITSQLTVGVGTFIEAYNAILDGSSGNFTVLKFTDGGGISGGTINGFGNALFNASSIGISCIGTNNAPAAPTYVTGPSVKDVTITNFGSYGVYLAYTNNTNVQNCTISNIGYAGVGGVSCTNGNFDANVIKSISPGTSGDSYGIFVDRNNGTSETAEPRSYYCTITNNKISDVTGGSNAQGIDTHAGVGFVISNNNVVNCKVGIFITASVISGAQALGPKNCIVTGNNLTTNTNVGYGIQIAGALVGSTTIDPADGIIVSNNTVTGYGIAGDPTSGAIRVQTSVNCTISNNIVKNSACNGILVNLNNKSLNITGNVISNPFDNTYPGCACIFVYDGNSSVNIANNQFVYSNASLGTYVAVASIRISAGLTNLDLEISKNSFNGIDATHLQYQQLTNTGVNAAGLTSLRGSVDIPLTSGDGNSIEAITFAKRFPVAPNTVDLVVNGNIAPGGKTVAFRISSLTATGFNIIAYPYDLTTWSSSGTLTVNWAVSV